MLTVSVAETNRLRDKHVEDLRKLDAAAACEGSLKKQLTDQLEEIQGFKALLKTAKEKGNVQLLSK